MAARAYSRGAKRRARRMSRSALASLAPTPKRKARGKKRMEEIAADPDAQLTVLEARARQCGRVPKDMTEMNHPALGEPAGRAIFVAREGRDAERLWDTYAQYTAAEAGYAKSYLGMRLHAKTGKVEYLVEKVEARPDDTLDLRDEEQRSRDASNRWMRWRGYIMRLPRHQQDAIRAVAHGDAEPMDAGAITPQGYRFLSAIEALEKIVDKN